MGKYTSRYAKVRGGPMKDILITANENICFLGKMASGKTYMANKLQEERGYELFALADELKRLAVMLVGKIDKSIHRPLFQDLGQILKKEANSLSSKEAKTLELWLQNDLFASYYWKNSDILHKPNFYINKLKTNPKFQEAVKNKKACIHDMRFIPEGLEFKEDFLIIKLECPEHVRVQRLVNLYGDFPISWLADRSEQEVDKTFYHMCIRENF